MYYVYILQSLKDGKLYYGMTSALTRRFWQHCLGLNKSTSSRRPLRLIYYEAYLFNEDARIRERFLKSGRGREVIRKHLKTFFGLYGDCSSVG